jgi:hypothetical protein
MEYITRSSKKSYVTILQGSAYGCTEASAKSREFLGASSVSDIIAQLYSAL